jgi:hypothetical protein
VGDDERTDWEGRAVARFGSVAGLIVVLLTAGASPSAASVTLGQLAPGNPPAVTCPTGFQFDLLQPTVTSGNTYVVPGNGTITAWSTNASANAGQMHTMKVFRNISGLSYLVVGHSGPRPMASGLNTFPASVAVKSGDVLGLSINDGSAMGSTCNFSAPGDRYLSLQGGLPDGGSGTFMVQPNFRVNVAAVFEPTNTFTFGGTIRNKKKGTATLPVNVPNPGELVLAGNGLKPAEARTSVAVAAPGAVNLLIKARGKKKRKLNENGKVKLSPTITYTPTGGTAATQSTKLKLKKKL